MPLRLPVSLPAFPFPSRQVDSGGAANKAGLVVGDEILKINDDDCHDVRARFLPPTTLFFSGFFSLHP